MGVGRQPPRRSNQKAPRHPEVNQENETSLEPDNQILAAALDGGDALALELEQPPGEVDRPRQPPSRIATVRSVRPVRTGASWALTVSTSGNSGTLGENVEHDGVCPGPSSASS